jgi:hypothetical protein
MKINVRSIFQIGFLTVIVAAAFSGFLRSKLQTTAADGTPQPFWETDLTNFGYQGRPPIHLAAEVNWGTATYQQGVAFTGPDVLAAFFVVHDEPSGATIGRRVPSLSDSYRLVVIFLSTAGGQFIRQLDWRLPTTSQSVSSPSFFPATEGRFIVRIGNSLSLYSPDFKLLAEHTAGEGFAAIASPAGETILLGDTHKLEGEWIEQFELLETDGLTVLHSWESAPQRNQILWGDEIASMTSQSVSIRTLDSVAKPLVTGREWFCGDWNFINKETIAMFQCGSTESLVVVSTTGKILHRFELGLEQVDGPVVASRNGHRFAVPTRRWGSGRNADPEALFARVFELNTDKPILTLKVAPHYSSSPNFETPQGDTRFGWGGLALSPGGDLLAVKSGPIVQLYKLTESAQRPECDGNCPRDEQAAGSQPPASERKLNLSASLLAGAHSKVVEEALSWLPADTETVTAANGPLILPNLDQGEDKTGKKESDEIAETFADFPLRLFAFKNGIVSKYFKDEKLIFALGGARNFRNPSGLGEGPFQGCDIAVFANDVSARADFFLKGSSQAVLKTERIEGHEVAVFQEKGEEDMWTTFVAFPRANVAIAASSKDYLREVLARIDGKRGERALPDTLTEWKYVNTQAAFWAVRHYNKKAGTEDPTSPFARNNAGLIADDQAIGLAFSFDPDTSNTARIVYLSENKDALQNLKRQLGRIDSESGVKDMNIRYRQIALGVVEGSYDLEHIESAETFGFLLGALLGHMVAV